VLSILLLVPSLFLSLAEVEAERPVTPVPQGICPAARENARTVMEDFLTGSSWTDERQEVGATGFMPKDIYRLRAPEDADMCAELWDKSPSSNSKEIARVYYRVGSYFFIIRVPRVKPSEEDLNLYGTSIEPFKGTSLEPKTVYLY